MHPHFTPKNSQKTGLICGSTLPPKANSSTELAKSPGLVQYTCQTLLQDSKKSEGRGKIIMVRLNPPPAPSFPTTLTIHRSMSTGSGSNAPDLFHRFQQCKFGWSLLYSPMVVTMPLAESRQKESHGQQQQHQQQGGSSSGDGFFQRRSIRAPQSPYPSPPISHSV